MSTVAVVGLGAMGSRIAAQLLSAGHEVVVWNRTAGKAEPLVELGAEPAASPADAARGAELAITMLADAEALRAVVDGPEGLAAGLEPGAAVIDMSTVGPAAVEWLESALPPGTPLLDAPVLGSLLEAESGSLTIFVGGPEELVQQWSPLLGALGTVVHVGPLGSGQAAKLVANTTLFEAVGVLGEALALAGRLGLSRRPPTRSSRPRRSPGRPSGGARRSRAASSRRGSGSRWRARTPTSSRTRPATPTCGCSR